MIERIISGGQIGVDLLGWVAARSFGLPTGGWMPAGFLTEAGPQPALAAVYGARAHLLPSYPPRTRQNVAEADWTLVLGEGRGSNLTARTARDLGKPYTQVPTNILGTFDWRCVADAMATAGVAVLNVAGSRASNMPPPEVRLVDKILAGIFDHWSREGHHVIPDLSDVHEDEAGEVGSRVGGGFICPFCRRQFFDHPHDQTRLTFGGHKLVPYLHTLCDGRIVKL